MTGALVSHCPHQSWESWRCRMACGVWADHTVAVTLPANPTARLSLYQSRQPCPRVADTTSLWQRADILRPRPGDIRPYPARSVWIDAFQARARPVRPCNVPVIRPQAHRSWRPAHPRPVCAACPVRWISAKN